MSARAAFTTSGADVDRGFPQLGVALSFAVTCACASRVDVTFYVRDASGLLLGRADRAGTGVTVWRFDPRPGAVRDRQLAAANAWLEEADPSGSGVQRTEVVMARTNAKKSTSRASGSARKTKTTTARRPAAARPSRSSTAKKASARPARATATAPRVKQPTAAQAMAISLLKRHRGEMKVADLTKAVVASGKVTLGGRTPEATVSAQIYTAAKAGRWFRKTKRGHVALLAGASS